MKSFLPVGFELRFIGEVHESIEEIVRLAIRRNTLENFRLAS